MALIVKQKVPLQILFSLVTSNGNAMENFLDHHGGMKIKLAQIQAAHQIYIGIKFLWPNN